MKLSEDLAWRGLIKDKTFENDSWLDKPQKFYLGIDASSPNMTIGNLAAILLAKRLSDAGWKAILLAGGATSLVGDPGGKDQERELKTKEEIADNVKGIKKEIEKILSGTPHELVNNLDWLESVRLLDFLREVGKHYPVAELIQREFVDVRLGKDGSGISYAEFSYSLLQGYDFWWLFKNKRVVMQIGASDQWGNMLSGVGLVRKKEGEEVNAFSMPLVINKQTGRKFGKSEEGAVWLDSKLTSPTQFYQFWINTDDKQVEDFLKIYTFLSRAETEKLLAEHSKNPAERLAQNRLAKEVTDLVHGPEDTHTAQVVTDVLTGKISIGKVGPGIIDQIRIEIPHEKSAVGDSILAAAAATIASSNSEARRLLESGGLYLNNQSIKREVFEEADFQNGRAILRRGKALKDSALIERR
jgi:tyrosyl-tRNA synthetase